MNSKLPIRIVVVLFSMAVLQRGVFTQIHIVGVGFDVLLLVAIAAGLIGGPDRGAIVGFFAGLTFDLFTQTPMGLYGLTYLIVGNFVGRFQQSVIHTGWWVPRTIAVAASATAVAIFVAVGALLGQPVPPPDRLVAIVIVTAVFSGLAIGPACRLMRWAFNNDELRPVVR